MNKPKRRTPTIKPDVRADEELRARVFISCGQNKTSNEPKLAMAISRRLINLDFDTYVAVREQTLRGPKENLFEQLSKSEYFLFIDFTRERLAVKNRICRGSLFSHQELAVASFLEIEVLAFQEKGVHQRDGVLGSVQGNAIPFSGRARLPDLVGRQVKQRLSEGKWSPRWRNELALESKPTRLIIPNTQGQMHTYFHLAVRNRHRRKTALNCIANLERVVSVDTGKEIAFTPFELKWEAYTLPNAHIAPNGERNIDAFCIRHEAPTTLNFYSYVRDATYIHPQITTPGRYELTYLVVADNFPPVKRSFILTLDSSVEKTSLAPLNP